MKHTFTLGEKKDRYKKIMYNPWLVAFLVACLFLLILLVVAIHHYNLVSQKTIRIEYAIDNNIYCSSFNSDACTLIIDTSLPLPDTSHITEYSNELALFVGNNVACIEYPSINQQLDDQIPIPITMTSQTNIFYNDKIIGSVWISNNDIIWVSFRGTRTKQEWTQDLMFDQVSYPYKVTESIVIQYSRATTRVEPPTQQIQSFPFNGMVHQGFLNVYTSIQSQLVTTINALPQSTIIVGGHSLGGALATLMMADYASYGNRSMCGYVFGCPRVGNQEFVNSIQTSNLFRIENVTDLVCGLPTTVSPNFVATEPPENVFIYASAGHLGFLFNDQRSSLMNNHAMQTYLNALRNT